MTAIDTLHRRLLALIAAAVAVAAIAAYDGLGIAICLFVLMLAPIVSVVGYEWKGHRHQAETLAG